jgi:hypothetical protein
VVLANELLERPRPHPRGQRRAAIGPLKIDIYFRLVEQILHREKYRARAVFASEFAAEIGEPGAIISVEIERIMALSI